MKTHSAFFMNTIRYEDVFTFNNLYQSYKNCRLSVSWKASVQNYVILAPMRIQETEQRLHDRTYASEGFYEFDIFERGKPRHIRSVKMEERVVQRCLCDYALLPALAPSLIYDCGACLEGKGYSFSQERCKRHLVDYIRKHGTEGYVLLFDFSKFFDNVSHEVLHKILLRSKLDSDLVNLTMYFIKQFGDKGLGLGSQISQILALMSANRLDHYIKEVLKVKYYARYMDDGYLIHDNKGYLKFCLHEIERICNELGIVLNRKKVQIIKLSRGFTFLKAKYFVTKTGKVIKKLPRKSITKQRRKLKKLRKMMDQGKITYEDAYASHQSWMAYAANFNSYRSVQSMTRLFNSLFHHKERL